MYLSQHVEKPRVRTPNLLSISWGEIIRLKHILCRSHRSRQTQTFLTAHSHFHNLLSASFSTTQIIFHLDFQSGNGKSWGSLLSWGDACKWPWLCFETFTLTPPHIRTNSMFSLPTWRLCLLLTSFHVLTVLVLYFLHNKSLLLFFLCSGGSGTVSWKWLRV